MSNKLDLAVTRENIEEILSRIADDIGHWEGVQADALYKQYVAEQKVNYIRAKTAIDFRTNPLAFGGLKVTEDTVKTVVEVQQEVQDAEAAYALAKLEVSNAKAVCASLDAKRSACKYLSELWLSNKLG